MHLDVTNSNSIVQCENTKVGAAMLGDWLAVNTSLTHLEYVLCVG